LVFDKLLTVGSGKLSKELNSIVDAINELEEEFEGYSDEAIKEGFQSLKEKVEENIFITEVEGFAYVREAAKRKLNQRHYDVQLFGGLVLLRNKIAEMKTGEGKTLVSTLPVSLLALQGKGVHVVTVNDYLAKRDAEWMKPIYDFLGLSVGLIQAGQEIEEKKNAYNADITYGTNNEFGFDYLRDNMAQNVEQLVQKDLNFALIDEVDSILVDESRTPLILSGRVEESTKWYIQFSKIVKEMKRDVHYEIEESKRQIHPTEIGIEHVEKKLGVDNLYEETAVNYLHYLTASLRARELYSRDVDYIVSNGQLNIVDEFTGRILEGRRYSEGLHQALEAKEGLKVQDENQTLATITFQNFFRLYAGLAGMTGTAKTEEEELIQIYNLEVIEIPTNMDIVRIDNEDVIYKTKESKLNAVLEDIKSRVGRGQPVLVGTVSVESSEQISSLLTSEGIIHSVLNAKNHEKEALIIAQAGRSGAVTVATNMAGRGVDIKLGGNSDVINLEEGSDIDKSLDQLTAEKENKNVIDGGGLYVLGTERHESRRIDNQLRGRSGRQGDPGESRFYISLEDELMRRFQGERIQNIMDKLNLPDDERIEQKMVTKSIERAQAQVESLNFEIRKNVLKFDQVLNQQREVIYKWRKRLLVTEGNKDLLSEWKEDVLTEIQMEYEQINLSFDTLDEYQNQLSELLSSVLNDKNKKIFLDTFDSSPKSESILTINLDSLFNQKMEKDNDFWEIGRMASLSFVDQAWRDHLAEMDHIRTGIGLRAMGQRDPLVEYQKEGYDLFEELVTRVKFSVIRLLFNFEKEILVNNETKKESTNKESVGRNEPCPCGSGKKYKRCHG
tara:strand:+ start:3557 stop:6079 length:2523 start_codon:yes stop_codon:yes gene_type:complete